MELIINNFDIKNSLRNFCKSNGGNNLRPDILFTTYYNCKHYAIIMEDTTAACGSIVVHWYVPYINVQNHKIINFVEGYNTTSDPDKKWVGPCAPTNPQTHNYNFILYALDKKFEPTETELNILDSSEYEEHLHNNNIKILSKAEKNFALYINTDFYKQFNVNRIQEKDCD